MLSYHCCCVVTSCTSSGETRFAAVSRDASIRCRNPSAASIDMTALLSRCGHSAYEDDSAIRDSHQPFQGVGDRTASFMVSVVGEVVNNVLLDLRLVRFLEEVTQSCLVKSWIGSSNRVR